MLVKVRGVERSTGDHQLTSASRKKPKGCEKTGKSFIRAVTRYLRVVKQNTN